MENSKTYITISTVVDGDFNSSTLNDMFAKNIKI